MRAVAERDSIAEDSLLADEPNEAHAAMHFGTCQAHGVPSRPLQTTECRAGCARRAEQGRQSAAQDKAMLVVMKP